VNIERFIAKRISGFKENRKRLSHFIIGITTVAIALSVSTMILSVAIVTGFREEIQDKIAGYSGHIIITNHSVNQSYEAFPITFDSTVYNKIKNTPGVKHVQVFALKAGLIKTKNEIQGVVLKGVSDDYDWSFFDKYMVQGQHLDITLGKRNKKVLMSKSLADMLDFHLNDNVKMFFIQDPPRLRKYKIAGIFDTGLYDFDKLYMIIDIQDIQKLNDWDKQDGFKITGYEVQLYNIKDIDKVTRLLKKNIAFGLSKEDEKLKVENIKEIYPDIFDWLAIVDMNVWVILVIMAIIAIINMTTGILILILEKTGFIGILKALGANNASIRKIFLYNSWYILRRGLLWGNLIGIGLALLQYYLHIIPLDPQTYYVSTVPVNLKITHLMLINIGTVIITIIMMIFPTLIISRIEPVKAIKFE